MIDLTKARAQFRERVGAALTGDPACVGRVCTGTLDWIADEAVKMARAVERHAEASTYGSKAVKAAAADDALQFFGAEWEPLREVAARWGQGSASKMASLARDLRERGLVEMRWHGFSFCMWRISPNGRLTDSSAKPSVLSEGAGADGGGSVAAGNGKGARDAGSDG